MNILFLIGNGFDLNLGMKTRYSDFYKFYTSIKSGRSLIESLKNEIDGNIKNWSDLELELGNYTKNLNSEEEFTEVYEDLGDRLAEYLQKIEENFDFDKIEKTKLNEYLSFPDNSLLAADRVELNAFRSKFKNSQLNVNVITFNYTKSFEKLVGYENKKLNIGSYNNQPIALQRIEHIHGYMNSRMIMGVNDVSQISNNKFHENQNIIDAFVKTNCNQVQKHTIDDWCKKQIARAQLICIFGSSIGDTDNYWWEFIGEQLKKEIRLIIFEKGEKIPSRRPYKRAIIERRKIDYFLSKTKLNENEKKLAANKIIVGINTNMFDLE